MCLEDFFKNFSEVAIWKVDNSNEIRLKGNFIRSIDPENIKIKTQFYLNFIIPYI